MECNLLPPKWVWFFDKTMGAIVANLYGNSLVIEYIKKNGSGTNQ